MKVVVRVRPFNEKEIVYLQDKDFQVVNTTNKVKTIKNLLSCNGNTINYTARNLKSISRSDIKRSFLYDEVLDFNTSQQDVYDVTTKPFIEKFLNGYNATIFAYGATGCGKTFTTFGYEEDLGIVLRTLAELFERQRSGTSMDIYMSYTEIYNEQLRDLIPIDGQSLDLNLREGSNGSTMVTNSSLHRLNTIQQSINLVCEGNKRRAMSPTFRNEVSSRSHAILAITVNHSGRTSAFSFVDLAGSERASKHHLDERVAEGTHINKSLLALGNCVNALARKSKHVPYRDSKLTRVLKSSLEGNCLMLMIACVSPSSDDALETLNTLNYADTARAVKAVGRQNVRKQVSVPASELYAQIKLLEVVSALKNEIYARSIDNWQAAELFVTSNANEVARSYGLRLDRSMAKKIAESCRTMVEMRKLKETKKRVRFTDHE